jgi:hypothetical protein
MPVLNQTTVTLGRDHSRKLGELADHFRRSKTMQLEWMIDIEWLTLFGSEKPEPVKVEVPVDVPF